MFETFSRLSGSSAPEASGDFFQIRSGFRARETPEKCWRVPNPPLANPLVAERAFRVSEFWGLTGPFQLPWG